MIKIAKFVSLIFAVAAIAVTGRATTYTFQPTDTLGGDSNTHDLGDLSHDSAYVWGINGTTENNLKNQLAGGQYYVTSAVLTISNLYNWDKTDTDNQLFIHLLDNPLVGVSKVVDDPNDTGVNKGVVSDYFSGKVGGATYNSHTHTWSYTGNDVNGQWKAYGYDTAGNLISTGATNIYLTQYHDPNGPVSSVNFSFSFTTSELSTLTSYITDTKLGGSNYADFGLGFDPDCHFYNDGICLTITTAKYPPPKSVPDNWLTLALLGIGLMGLAVTRRMLRS